MGTNDLSLSINLTFSAVNTSFLCVYHQNITELSTESRKIVHWWTKDNYQCEITRVFGISTNRLWATSCHSTFRWSNIEGNWLYGCLKDLLGPGQKNTRSLQKLIFTPNFKFFHSDDRFWRRISVFRSISVVDKSIRYVSSIFLARLWTYQNHLEAVKCHENAWLKSWMTRGSVTAFQERKDREIFCPLAHSKISEIDVMDH